tara:strand:+ start:329 stop:466 length:138 start_codon:yes stop_codon:yes gene_type:complete
MKTFREYHMDYGTPESVKYMKKMTPGQNKKDTKKEKKKKELISRV